MKSRQLGMVIGDRNLPLRWDAINKKLMVYVNGAWVLMPPHMTTTRVTSGGAGSTTSASYAEWPTNCRVTNFVKSLDGTKITAHIDVTNYITGVIGRSMYGVDDGTNQTDCAALFFNVASAHQAITGSVELPALVAGTYTFKALWKAPDATTTVVVDANDYCSLTITESY